MKNIRKLAIIWEMRKIVFFVLLIITGQLSLVAQAPSWAWARSAGLNGSDRGLAVSCDRAGNIYTTGSFASDSISFDSETLFNGYMPNFGDFFIAKYRPDGSVIWARSAPGPLAGADEGRGVACDKNANIYVVGSFSSPKIIFGNDTLTRVGGGDFFVAKYDSSGNILWARSGGGTSDEFANGVDCDGQGNIYVTGTFLSSSITVGTTTVTNSSAASVDIFILKYDPTGVLVWAKKEGGANDDNAYNIGVDSVGNSYISGDFLTSITIGGITQSGSGVQALLFKYDANGNAKWVRGAGGNFADRAYDVALDTAGYVYITGSFANPNIVFGTYTLTCGGADDIFLVKYDTSGVVLWARKVGASGKEVGQSVAVDRTGSPLISGYFTTNPVFGSTTLFNVAGDDAFLAKYSSAGTVLWAKSAGSNADERAPCIATDIYDNVYVTGAFNGNSISFAPYSLTNATFLANDFYLAKCYGTFSTNISQLVEFSDFMVYPNPFQDELIFQSKGHEMEVSIFNVTGELVLSVSTTNGSMQIPTADWPAGIYFYRITSENRQFFGKVVKQ